MILALLSLRVDGANSFRIAQATLPSGACILACDEVAAGAGSHYTRRTLGHGIKAFMGLKQLRYRSISACCASP